ncbi:Catechol O-methyltransferase domain-containing protein 1 [Exaiptasia diaphana]|nr:Catechol O-methyltransferase domain-containing protein 1 [Exaiptasia diaphana]
MLMAKEQYLDCGVFLTDELIANGEAGTFDFAFVDADKESYDAYYEKCLVLVRKGGMIAVDNVIWSGKVLQDPADMDAETLAIHTLNQKIHKDSRVDMAMLPLADGMILAVKL